MTLLRLFPLYAPSVSFTVDELDTATTLTYKRIIGLSFNMNHGINPRNSTLSVTLDNKDNSLTDIFTEPPIGCSTYAEVDDELFFTGILASVTIGDTITLNMEG